MGHLKLKRKANALCSRFARTLQSRPIPQTAETAPRPPADSTDTWAALPVGRESAKQAVAKGARTGSWTDARVREAEVGDFY